MLFALNASIDVASLAYVYGAKITLPAGAQPNSQIRLPQDAQRTPHEPTGTQLVTPTHQIGHSKAAAIVSPIYVLGLPDAL